MEPTNCPRCGKVFMKIREPICSSCLKEEEEKYEEVRAYVKEHPNRSIKEVAEVCNVSIKSILRYIRDGKLEASTGMHGEVTCGKCGVPITSGRICKKCAAELGQQVASMKPEAEAQKSENRRMYTK